jgi:hypothetical protein
MSEWENKVMVSLFPVIGFGSDDYYGVIGVV